MGAEFPSVHQVLALYSTDLEETPIPLVFRVYVLWCIVTQATRGEYSTS